MGKSIRSKREKRLRTIKRSNLDQREEQRIEARAQKLQSIIGLEQQIKIEPKENKMDRINSNTNNNTGSPIRRGRDRTVKPAFQSLLIEAQRSSDEQSTNQLNSENADDNEEMKVDDELQQQKKQTKKKSIKLNPFNPYDSDSDDEISYVEKGRPALIGRNKMKKAIRQEKILKNNEKLRKRSMSRTNRILRNWNRMKPT